MKNLSQRYLGVAPLSAAKELKEKGYTVIRNGSLCQIFGGPDQGKIQKEAFRGELWQGPRRDTLKLHLDTERIIKRLVPLLREEIHELQDPGVKLNYVRKIGHGTSLHVIDQYRNETLDVHVAATPWDNEVWMNWRLTHWTDNSREIYEEGKVEYPDTDEWDDEKQQMRVVNALLKPIKKWLKGEDRE